jgi:hypothetical protein
MRPIAKIAATTRVSELKLVRGAHQLWSVKDLSWFLVNGLRRDGA